MKIEIARARHSSSCNTICEGCGGTLETRHLSYCNLSSSDQMAIEQVWRVHEHGDSNHYDNRLVLGFINKGKLACLFKGHKWQFGRYRGDFSRPYFNTYTDTCYRCGQIKERQVLY